MTLIPRGLAENWRAHEKGLRYYLFHAVIFVVSNQVWTSWKNFMKKYIQENYCYHYTAYLLHLTFRFIFFFYGNPPTHFRIFCPKTISF